jgi:hypothetical protein
MADDVTPNAGAGDAPKPASNEDAALKAAQDATWGFEQLDGGCIGRERRADA